MEFIFQFFAQLFSESELMGSVDNEIIGEQEGALAIDEAETTEEQEDGLVNIFKMVDFH